jgi:hypothetical protein
MTKKMTIAVDVDDVLVARVGPVLAHLNSRFGTSYSIDTMQGESFNNASLLIDDRLATCREVANLLRQAILFGDYAWNRTSAELPAGLRRAINWKTVMDYLHE